MLPPYPRQAMFGFDARHTHYNPFEHSVSPTNVSTLVPAWTAITAGPIFSSPVVANGILYLGSIELPGPVGYVSAFDAVTGTLIWMTPTGSKRGFPPDLPPIRPSPAVANNGFVYANGVDGHLYALDAAAGTLLWTTPVGFSSQCSSPTIANGVVYASAFFGGFIKLIAFDAELGTPIWTSNLSAIGGNEAITSPAVADDLVFLAVGGYLFAVTIRTGELVYRFDPSQGSGSLYIHSSPAIVNQEAYVAATGSGPTSFLTTLYAVDSTRGSLLWEGGTVMGSTDSSPAVANGIVYIGAADQLYAFDALSCKAAQGCDPLWTATTGGAITSSPTVANGVVYVGSADSKLYAFDASSGALLWTATTGGSISSSPAVAYGMVYIGSSDGQLYAFRLPD